MVGVEGAVVGGRGLVVEHRQLTFGVADGAIYKGFVAFHASVVDKVTGGVVVGAVKHQIVLRDNLFRVFGGQTVVVCNKVHVVVQTVQRRFRTLGLRLSHLVLTVEDLPL